MKVKFEKKNYLILNKQPLAGSTFINWMKVLVENKFKIDWKFIPKAMYVTMMILVVSPLRLNEKRKCDKKFESVVVKEPIFIIGHWRSGTTFLHYLLGEDKNLGYTSTMYTLDPHIFLMYEKLLRNVVANSLPTKRPMDNLEMQADKPYEEEYAIANISPYSFYHAWYFPKNIDMYFKRDVLYEGDYEKNIYQWKKTYSYFLKKLTYKHNGKQIILKSLVNTAKIKHILEMYPDAKFIHICRNPYNVYKSTWKLYNSILPIFSFQHIDYEEFDRSIIDIYKNLYKKYFEERKLIPKENLIELKYEDFIEEPIKTLEEIYSKFNIKEFEEAKPAFEKYVKKHENYKRNHHTIDPKTESKVYKQWKQSFTEFGYSK